MGAELGADMFPSLPPQKERASRPTQRPENRGRGKLPNRVCDTCGSTFLQKPGMKERCNRCSDGRNWLAHIKRSSPQHYRTLVDSL